MIVGCLKKALFVVAPLVLFCSPLAAGQHGQLIEPTRSLDRPTEGTGLLSVLSEPPGMEVQVAGRVIGKTPIFSVRFPAGIYLLRLKDSQTDIHIVAGTTTAISWFKGHFVEIPRKPEPSREFIEEPPRSAREPQPEQKPDVQKGVTRDPYYWPLNPRGPIP